MGSETWRGKTARIAIFVSQWKPVAIELAGGREYLVTASDVERFLVKTEAADNGCLIWTAACDDRGYAVFRVGGKQVKAYRFAYAAFIGPIPDGLQVDHYCHTRAIQAGTCGGGNGCQHRRCVNPDPEHLRTATPAQNALTSLSFVAENKNKTHCVNGHPFEGDDLYVYPTGQRGCRECRRAADKRFRERLAEADGRVLQPLPQDRTHCPQGHPYDYENTIRDASTGRRICRECRKRINKASKERAKERAGLPDRSPGKKTHCKHGHEFTTENTRIAMRNTPNGVQRVRICRTCEANYYAKQRLRKQADGIST